MRDKRPVDELSIEELERILVIRKREARLARLRRYEGAGRVVAAGNGDEIVDIPDVVAPSPAAPDAQAKPAEVPDLPDYDGDTPHFEDELDALRSGRRRNARRSGAAVLWNRLLVLVELAAAVGLVFIFVSLFQSLQEISQTTANIQAQYQASANAIRITPTPTPVIGINRLVLPVGHKVTLNAQGVVVATSLNLDEVPAQYRDQYQAMMLAEPEVTPTPSPAGPIRIEIAKINVDATVVSGDGWRELQQGVGHHLGSKNPGERGNMVLSAHNDVYGEIFRYLDKLKPGDEVIVYTLEKQYAYIVRDTKYVSPDAVWVLDSVGDERQLTLISCYPYQKDYQRIVVFATLKANS
jgi:sortase A